MILYRSLQATATIAVLISSFFSFTAAFYANSYQHGHRRSSRLANGAAEESLQRTASQVQRLLNDQEEKDSDDKYQQVYQSYIRQPANALKAELKERRLPDKGRKPDLAQRLADDDLQIERDNEGKNDIVTWTQVSADAPAVALLGTFCGIPLSAAAGRALAQAQFTAPSSIQAASIPLQWKGKENPLILHAETGSGKTLAYLLPITEQLWMQKKLDFEEDRYALVMTPTRELAAQVAGVASVLSPPGTVRLVSHPTNLANDGQKDRGEVADMGGRLYDNAAPVPRLIIGSAKSIHHSLFGDGVMPASPTSKPEAQYILQHTNWVVLDEVDRLLNVAGKKNSNNRHEKPAAIVTSSVARQTLGKAQIVAASATVGRSLKREVARVLGLGPKEQPRVVRAGDPIDDPEPQQPSGRAVTIPDTVQHYVVPVDTTSVGKLLTSAFFCLKNLHESSLSSQRNYKILMVLTKGCGINTQTATGALKHFRCQPEPQSLLDMLEAHGTDHIIEKHRQVSRATGIGQSTSYFSKEGDIADSDASSDDAEGYLIVTGEDSVRGLHLDGLDFVIVVGRAAGPDEYTHIAGRTGRAGRSGKVISVLSDKHTAAIAGWESMLGVKFTRLQDTKDVATL